LGVSQTWCDFLSWRGSYWRFIGSTIAGFLRSLKTVCRQAAGCVLRRRSLADVRVTFSFAKGRAAGFRQLLKLRREQRQEIQGKARSRATVTHIGLLHWGDLMEDFLSEINVSLKEFREEMTGGWMFGYIRALKMCGIDSTLICVSAQVHRIETWTHLPTGARICVLPASRLYRWLAGHGISSAVWKNDSVPQRSFFVRTGVRFLQDLLPYLATPVTQLRRELKTRKIDAILCQEYEHARFDLSMVAGVLSPDEGEVKLGASLKMGYFSQQALDVLDPDLTIEEQLQHDFPHESIGVLRSLAGAFQFSGEDVDKKIRMLSGGEKTRLVMARMLLNPPNFLVLDEPTNHLDLATKEMLLDSLSGFDGTMLFVSHDRAFLRALSNRVLELGGESGTETAPHVYPGSYVEYVERTGHEAPGVHR